MDAHHFGASLFKKENHFGTSNNKIIRTNWTSKCDGMSIFLTFFAECAFVKLIRTHVQGNRKTYSFFFLFSQKDIQFAEDNFYTFIFYFLK